MSSTVLSAARATSARSTLGPTDTVSKLMGGSCSTSSMPKARLFAIAIAVARIFGT